MPPKKRTQAESNSKNKKRAKTTTVRKKNNQIITRSGPNTSNQSNELWYKKYQDMEENIAIEGVMQLFDDLDVSLESVYPILISWKLNASEMGSFSKEEWFKGIQSLKINSFDQLKEKLPLWIKEIEKAEAFKQMYLYTFGYAKTPGQRAMNVDHAIDLWKVLLEEKSNHIPMLIQFLKEKKPVNTITKDQWYSLLDFIHEVPFNLEGYDNQLSWPVLFDDYVNWRLKNE